MKKYRLAVDENGSPFVLNSKGSIDFGYITEEMNLPAAPIRIAEGNERYGLLHMEQRHGEQIRDNGFSTALEFVEYVSIGDDILWIPGIRRSNIAPIDKNTSRVIIIKYVSG